MSGSPQVGGRNWRGQEAPAILAQSADRLIDAARVVLAGLLLIAIWVEPLQPAGDSAVVRVLLLAYLAYAAVLGLIDAMRPPSNRWQIILHGIDIFVFTALMHYTPTATGPFFVTYTFALIAGTLRWGWRGALATSVILVVLLLITTYADNIFWPDLIYSSYYIVLRVGHLTIASILLASLGAVLERNRERLARLAEWPQENYSDSDGPALVQSLGHAAAVTSGQGIVVAWEYRNEPALQTAHWRGAQCAFGRDANLRLRDLVTPELAHETFLANGSKGGFVSRQSQKKPPGQPILDQSFSREFAILDYCSAPFATDNVIGRVFILAPGPFIPGLLKLCDVVAARIGAELEQFALRASLSMAAVVRERVRLARDLHDGVLQDLAAARLMVKSLGGASPEKLKSDLDEIAGILAQQQQRIRSFVRTANPKPPPDWDFVAEFRALVATLQQQWRCEILAELRPPKLILPGNIGFQVFLIFGEAIANAVQHGRSRRIVVEIERKEQVLHVLIRDDGRGLPIRPGNEASGPFSLRQRISDLNGKLSLNSSIHGLELKIELPIA